MDCHRVHAPRQGHLHIRCVLDDLLHRRHSLRLFFFAVLPVCVHVCDSVTVLGRARRRLDDHGNDDDLTPKTSSILPANPLLLRPRLVLVPPWVTIEFGPSPASSQPNPGSTFGFHHTLSLTRTLYTPSLPICLCARSHISAVLLHSLYTYNSIHLPILLDCSVLPHDTTHSLRNHYWATNTNYCGANLV